MACHRRRLLGAVRIGVVLHQRRVVPLYVVALLVVRVQSPVVGCSCFVLHSAVVPHVVVVGLIDIVRLN